MQSNNSVILDWLHRRKITDEVIKEFGISESSDGRIIIPINSSDGKFHFNKYRRHPLSEVGSKYTYDKGGISSLYCADKIKDKIKVLVVEGEMDALVCWSANIPAVSSTGGAGTFKAEWVEFLKDKEVTLCFDNDEAGGLGMAKVLKLIPWAKVLFLPDRPGIKDISDYVTNGGDLHSLLGTAIRLSTLEDIIQNRIERVSVWQSTWFHDAFIKENTKPIPEKKDYQDRSLIKDEVLRAKLYPIDALLRFSHNKTQCIWHMDKEKDDLHFYTKTNTVYCFCCGKSGDAIDVYRKLHNCSFKEAVKALQ